MRVLLRIVILFFTSLALVKNNACPLMGMGKGWRLLRGGFFALAGFVALGDSHGNDRAMRLFHDFLCDTSHHQLGPAGSSVCAHHNHVGFLRLSDMRDFP